MEIKENLLVMNEKSLPLPSSIDLRGRQSVRATFKLSTKAIDTLSIVAVHLGIKQKSVFDHLIEDVQSLRIIAREVDPETLNAMERVQKTFVISRRSLRSLEEIARQFNTSRDALVELSVQRLLPILFREQEKHEQRKKLLSKIDHFLNHGLRLHEELETDLGEDDVVSSEFRGAIKSLIEARSHIGAFIVKGQVIENFND
jgi:predicted DNA-binding protein YlxM (UPF0122 family)